MRESQDARATKINTTFLGDPASLRFITGGERGFMPGQRVSSARKKIDIVLVAARFAAGGRQLALARGYERHGSVWSDLILFDRSALVERVRAGRRVVTGREKELPGDFEVRMPVRITESAGETYLTASGEPKDGDGLGLPLF